MATQPNWWEDDPLVAPANDPGFTGYIPGVAKMKEAKAPVFVPQGATQMMLPDGSFAPVPGAPDEKDAVKAAIDNLGVDELLLNVKRGRNALGTGWATGAWGKLAEMAPGGGTPRQNFLGALEGIQGGVIMEKLALLKDLSKTGASGMGALSEREGQRMASAVASLREDMSQQEYETTFQIIERHAKALQAIRDGKDPRDAAVAKQYGIPALTDIEAGIDGAKEAPTPDPAGRLTDAAYAADGTGSGDAEVDKSAIGVAEFTAEQKAAYEGFWKANPDPKPEQLTTFLSSIGIDNVTNAADIIAKVKEGAGYSTTRLESDYRTKVKQRLKTDEERGRAGGAVDTLINQGATVSLSDEASGVGGALANVLTSPITGNFDPLGGYRIGRDVERMRIADAREQLGYGGTGIEFLGALATMGPGALTRLAPAQAARQAGKVGAAGGALSGFGAGEGAEQSLAGAGGGALFGYGLGRFGPQAIERVLPAGMRSPRGMDPRLGAAAEAENVRLRQPMIEGNRKAVNKAGRLEADPSTAAYMQQSFAETGDDIAAGVNRLGQGGRAQEPQSMGETLRQAAKDIQKVDREGATSAYDAARKIQPDAAVDPASMRSKIDAKIAQLQRRPNQNREQITELQRYRADLDKPLPLQEIRDMRTEARDNISGLNIARSSAAKRADRFMMEIIDGTKDDIARALTPEAKAAWEAADAQFRDNQKLYRDALKPFFGEDFDKLPAEQIFDKVKAAANRNGRALAGFHRRLTAEQSRDLAATIAEGLGRRGPDEDFSTALFVSQARKFSPSARETIFGPSGAASFDNLLLLSRRLQRAQSQINTSKTARPVIAALRQRAGVFLTAMLTGGGALAGDAAGAGVGLAVGGAALAGGAIRKGLSAKALMNPRVSRWMADAADVSTPQQAKELTNRLGGIIAREPAVANELQPFYDLLTERLTPALAANPQAEGEDDDR